MTTTRSTALLTIGAALALATAACGGTTAPTGPGATPSTSQPATSQPAPTPTAPATSGPAATSPGSPGTYTATLTGDAPGAGSWNGQGAILCTSTNVDGTVRWTVSSGPLSGGLSGILMTRDGDRSTIYVTPTGLGIEAQWGADSTSASASRVEITGVFGNPSIVTGVAEYTYGVNPPIPYSLTVSVACAETYS